MKIIQKGRQRRTSQKRIGARILKAITFLSLIGMLISMSGSIIGMVRIRNEIGIKITQTEAEQQAVSMEQIEKVIIKELCIDVEGLNKQYENALEQYKNAVKIFSETVAGIYEYPEKYGEGEILNRSQENSKEEKLYYCLSKELSYREAENELKKFGGAGDIIRSIKNAAGAKAIYFASANGYMIAIDDNSEKRKAVMVDVAQPQYFKESYDPRNRGWYICAEEGEYGFFYEDIDGENVITCSYAVYVQGELKGVAAIDIQYSKLQYLVKSDIENESEKFLEIINADGETMLEINNASNKAETFHAVTVMGKEFLEQMEKASQQQKNVISKTATYSGIKYVTAGKKIAESNLYLAVSENMDKAAEAYQENVEARLWQFEDLQKKTEQMIRNTMYIFVLLFAVIFLFIILVSRVVSFKITEPIQKLTADARQIGKGNLGHKVEIHTGDELEELGMVFNQMTKSLAEYMENLKLATMEQERIATELNVASSIQMSMLPGKFPAFPEEKSFDVCAFIQPAKAVGGDYYDYFMPDERHLITVIADVSGKGVPAALFMMMGKTLMRSQAALFLSPAEIMKEVNKRLNENNEEMMFITSFLCIFDLVTGELSYANAGHNPPLIYKKRTKNYQYVENDADLVLAVMEDTDYQNHTLWLEPGDKLFLYTDGVTDAMNEQGRLFGNDSLKELLNREEYKEFYGERLLHAVHENIQEFAGSAEQADDITMISQLFLEYKSVEKHEGNIWSLKTAAVMEHLDLVLDFVKRLLEKKNALENDISNVQFVADEIFSNIAAYAYPDKKGEIVISCDLSQESQIILMVEDCGIAYNPLEEENPDIEQPLSERKIGGLGIFLVKNMVDHMYYSYEDGKNKLTLIYSIK